jgi:hypothetical protein
MVLRISSILQAGVVMINSGQLKAMRIIMTFRGIETGKIMSGKPWRF